MPLQVESLDKGFELLEDMSRQGLQPDCSTYATLLNLCAEAKQGHRAHQLLQVCVSVRLLLVAKAMFAKQILHTVTCKCLTAVCHVFSTCNFCDLQSNSIQESLCSALQWLSVYR